MKRQFLTAIAITALLAAAAFAQAADATAKAEQILKQARAAIGDENKLKNLQSLSASGTQRTMFGDRQNEQELQLDILLPDKILRTNSGQFGANTMAYNGGQLWNEFVPAVGMGGPGFGGGGGDRIFIAGAGGPGGGRGPGNMTVIGGPGGPGGADNPMVKYFQQGQRRDLLLPLIGMLLYAPPSAQVQYSYLGEAPGPEGSKLDAINAKNAEGLNLVLYFDQQTHQLVGIKYKQKQLGRGMNFGGGRGGPGGQGGQGGQRQGGGQPGGAPGQAQGRQAAQPQPGQAQGGQPGQRPEMTPEERERRMKEFMENFEKAPEVDFSWSFSDYKSVGGLNLPHRLTRSQGGTPNEEWEISKYKVNPKLSPDKFVKKEKPAQ
jgi:hypothetical protein